MIMINHIDKTLDIEMKKGWHIEKESISLIQLIEDIDLSNITIDLQDYIKNNLLDILYKNYKSSIMFIDGGVWSLPTTDSFIYCLGNSEQKRMELVRFIHPDGTLYTLMILFSLEKKALALRVYAIENAKSSILNKIEQYSEIYGGEKMLTSIGVETNKKDLYTKLLSFYYLISGRRKNIYRH